MDKLIDYEGLGTFQTNLLNDNKVSPIATWSSEKISDELNNKANTSDLSAYATTSAMTTALAGKQNTLTAGSNISINNNVISASGTAEGYVWDASKPSFAIKYDGWGLKANTASGTNSFASGVKTTASGYGSFAEGTSTHATGNSSHAEGLDTTASGNYSHSEGYLNTAQNQTEHAEGQCNISHKTNDNFGNAGNTIHSIGIGTSTNASTNAEEIMQNGDMYVYGVGNYDGIHIKNEQGAPANTQTLQEVITNKQDVLTAGNNITIDGNYIDAKGYWYDSSYHSISSGLGDVATGDYSWATGQYTKAQGLNSFTEGAFTIAKNEGEYAGGISNISHKEADYNHLSSTKIAGNTQYSIGIGWNHNNTENHPKNALEVMQNGDYYLYGVGNYDGVHIKNEQGAPANLQTLQEVISSLTSTIASLEARIAALENPNA